MILASGLSPNSSTLAWDARTSALAPSFKFDAFAAVIVPVLLNTGLSEGTLAGRIFLYSSSSAMTVSPLRASLIVTGTTSSANRPAFHDSAARRYDSSAKLSWSSRVTECLRAVSSALLERFEGQPGSRRAEAVRPGKARPVRCSRAASETTNQLPMGTSP